jgi:predicted esterase
MLKMQTVAAQSNHTATIFFLHGLGDCGESWMPVGQMFAAAHPNIKWVFPDAPIQAVTLNSGMRMPAWYDIKSLESKEHQDEQGLYKTVKSVENLVNLEIAAGIPSDRIIVGGFSQGAAVALLTSVMSTIKLGGIIGLSGYLPLDHMVDSVLLSHPACYQCQPKYSCFYGTRQSGLCCPI